MKGTTKEPFPYILDDDKESSKSEQTTFWIKPWGGLSGAKIAARYASTERQGRGGYNEVNVGKRRRADEATWLEIIDHIDNFCFSSDFKEYWTNGKPGFVKTITEQTMLVAVANDLTLDQFNEIVEVAANSGRQNLTLSQADKKK